MGGALERIERELFAADWAAAREVHGDAVAAGVLARTGAQRRHDALVEMATRAMTAPAHGKRPRPLVTVMVGYETFAGRVCELAGGTVIAPGTVAELLGHDETLIERAVFDSPNRITDISQARSFRGTLRRILEIKHPRCDHLTCHVPAARCEADHIIAWSRGGLTTASNGRLACDDHNRWYFQTDQRLDTHTDTDTTRHRLARAALGTVRFVWRRDSEPALGVTSRADSGPPYGDDGRSPLNEGAGQSRSSTARSRVANWWCHHSSRKTTRKQSITRARRSAGRSGGSQGPPTRARRSASDKVAR